MRELLSANFLRLKKSKLFWVVLIVNFLLGAAFALTDFREGKLLDGSGFIIGYSLDRLFFRFAVLVPITMVIFVPLFLGTEYSDGTIRNKLVVGHSRLSIYFASLITATAVGFAFSAAYMLAVLAVGAPLLPWFEMPGTAVFLFTAGALALIVAFSALYTLAAMLCSRKAALAVICMLTVLLLLVGGSFIQMRLDADEYLNGYIMSADGQLQPAEPTPNPRYLQGTERQVYQFLYDFTPGGQALQYTDMSAKKPALLAAYSLVIVVVSTGAGGVLFRRKDLK